MTEEPNPPAEGNVSPTSTPKIQEPEPVDAVQTKAATAEQLTEVEKQMTGFEKATLRWAKIAVALSGLAALFVCAQWYEMHEGGVDTHDLALAAGKQADKMSNMSDAADKIRQAAENMVTQDQKIADNAKAATDASTKQSAVALQATIDASKLDERAWVVLRGVGGIPELNKPWNVQVFFGNTGKTPAKHVLLGCHAVLETSESAESSINFVEAAIDMRPTLIAPNDTNTFCQLDPLQPAKMPQVTQDLLNAFSDRKMFLFSYGFVTYEDVFGAKHWLSFCRMMGPAGKAWEGCETHNDTGDGDPPPN